MVGSHYNRAWTIHSTYSEGLERLHLTRILTKKRPQIPYALNNYCMDYNSTTVGEIFIQNCSKLLQEYDEFRKEVTIGSIGKTAPF